MGICLIRPGWRLCRTKLYLIRPCAKSIMQISIVGVNCVDSIMRILLCIFYRVIVRSIAQLLSCAPRNLLCRFYHVLNRTDSIVRVPSCGFCRSNSIVRLCVLRSAGFVVQILSCARSYGFHCANVIMRILSFEFHRTFVRSIARIPLCAPLSRFYCALYRADSIVRL